MPCVPSLALVITVFITIAADYFTAWPTFLTRRGAMSRGRPANLSRRRSSFLRLPSGEDQYWAGDNHPAIPARRAFLISIDLLAPEQFPHLHTPAFSFSLMQSKHVEELADPGLSLKRANRAAGKFAMPLYFVYTQSRRGTFVRPSGRGGEKLDGRKMLRNPLLGVPLLVIQAAAAYGDAHRSCAPSLPTLLRMAPVGERRRVFQDRHRWRFVPWSHRFPDCASLASCGVSLALSSEALHRRWVVQASAGTIPHRNQDALAVKLDQPAYRHAHPAGGISRSQQFHCPSFPGLRPTTPLASEQSM